MEREPQKVMFFSSEDSLEYTLKAKLRRSGANLDNIYSASLRDERFSQIKFNSPILKDLIKEVKPALVIFDPIQAFIPPDIQMSQRNAMRNCLNPLIGLGEEYGTTFLIVVHTNKRQGAYGRNRISDSSDLWDIARSVLITGVTKGNVRYLSQEKSNYGEPGKTALYTIEDGIAVFKEYCDKHDADFARERDLSTYQAPQRQSAEAFIIDFLKNGKRPTAELDEAAKAAGITVSTLRRAKEELRNKNILGFKPEGYGQKKAYYSFMIPASAASENIYFHRDCVIERKASLEELSGNLAQNRERFEAEFLRAGNDGCKVYLMIESPGGYSDIIGHKYRTEFTPAAFMASMKTWESRFGCNVQFIDKQYSGYFLYSTFSYFMREKSR